MATTKFKHQDIQTAGSLPDINAQAQDFKLLSTQLKDTSLADYKGQNLILNIFPSIDTGVCATSVRKFNEKAESLDNTKVLCVSNDLPFALKRFCDAEGLDQVETLSGFRSSFGDDYGLTMTDGPLEGLLARSIVKINEEGKVVYTELVPDIGIEPDYDAALNA